MSSTTLPVCPKTGSTSPSLTVPLHCSGKSGMRPLSLAVRNHSPTGPAWGYDGSGPAQLALAIRRG